MIQLLWLTLIAANTAMAGVWWWISPGGSVLNQVGPPVVMVVLLVGLLARGKASNAILPPILFGIFGFWIGFGISARIVFFESWRSLWNLPFLGGLVLGALAIRQFGLRRKPVWLIPLLVVVTGLCGWAMPGQIRSPESSTQPVGAEFTAPTGGTTDHKLIKLTKDAQLRPGDGRLVVQRDHVVLNVQPMLTFVDRSPDRASIGLAPAGMSFPTTRTLTTKTHEAARWLLAYKDEDQSQLEVTIRDGAVHLDSLTRLRQPVYSHSNSFAELTVMGHKKLTVSFSPAPTKRIEVPIATGPAHFAFLDESGTFHVMQGARPPFTELASGPMARKDPLVLTLYDADKPVFAVTFEDWAQQASTQRSPTAGNGVPQNLIELQRGGEPEGSPVVISLSLAATTIGRGTETVGHAAGVYRDRITVTLP
jgi:hypothetical protein